MLYLCICQYFPFFVVLNLIISPSHLLHLSPHPLVFAEGDEQMCPTSYPANSTRSIPDPS